MLRWAPHCSAVCFVWTAEYVAWPLILFPKCSCNYQMRLFCAGSSGQSSSWRALMDNAVRLQLMKNAIWGYYSQIWICTRLNLDMCNKNISEFLHIQTYKWALVVVVREGDSAAQAFTNVAFSSVHLQLLPGLYPLSILLGRTCALPEAELTRVSRGLEAQSM